MKIQFTGNFEALADFEDKLTKVPDALKTISEQLAEETLELIREGFEKETDPYGKRWKPLKLRQGRILQDTGGLKGAWHLKRATHSGFAVSNAKSYAVYHQRGTGLYGSKKRRIKPIRAKALRVPVRGGKTHYFASVAGSPKRRMVPESGRIPTHWRRRYVETAREVLTEIFR